MDPIFCVLSLCVPVPMLRWEEPQSTCNASCGLILLLISLKNMYFYINIDLKYFLQTNCKKAFVVSLQRQCRYKYNYSKGLQMPFLMSYMRCI